MSNMSKALTFTTLMGTFEMIDGATACLKKPVDIDLHSQRIGIWNLEEKINPVLPIHSISSSEIFSINLSGNVIMDRDIPKLLDMFKSYNLMSRLSVLDLSNNRLKFEGVKALIPLLASDNLKWLDLSVNNLMVDDFIQLWEEIEREVYRYYPSGDDISSYIDLRDHWAAKVVLLPKDYHPERFPLAKPFVDAHRQYYASH